MAESPDAVAMLASVQLWHNATKINVICEKPEESDPIQVNTPEEAYAAACEFLRRELGIGGA